MYFYIFLSSPSIVNASIIKTLFRKGNQYVCIYIVYRLQIDFFSIIAEYSRKIAIFIMLSNNVLFVPQMHQCTTYSLESTLKLNEVYQIFFFIYFQSRKNIILSKKFFCSMPPKVTMFRLARRSAVLQYCHGESVTCLITQKRHMI